MNEDHFNSVSQTGFFVLGFEHAINLAVLASERGYTLSEILISLRRTVNKQKENNGLTEIQL